MPDESTQIKPESKPRSNSKKLKKFFNKKTFTYLACAIVCIASVVIIVVVIVASINREAISDEYFVSDDTKSVISLDATNASGDGSSSTKTHVVYLHEGDEITGLKTYFEYATPEAAQAALETIKSNPDFTNAEVNGRYIVVTSDASQFKGLTVSDVKQQAAAIKQMQEANKATQNQQETQQEEQPQEEQPQEAPQE